MIPLRKVSAGVYATLDGRYQIEHQDGVTECEHPLCETLHRRFHERLGNSMAFAHMISYTSWHIWDTQTGDYLVQDEFDTKRRAHQELTDHLQRQGP